MGDRSRQDPKPDERLADDGPARFEVAPDRARDFRLLAESAHDCITEIDGAGRILWVNHRFTELFGYGLDEVAGRSSLELIHDEDRADVEGVRVEAMDRENPVDLAFRALCKDGRWIWVEVTGQPYRTSSGETRAVLITRDVTDRVEADLALREQLEVERQIALLSRRFLGLPSEQIREGIQQGLEAAADIAGADRCSFLTLAKDPLHKPVRYHWCAEGVAEPPREPWSSAMRRFRWSGSRLLAGETLHVPDVSALPPEAAAERESLEAAGTRAYLMLGVRDGERPSGFLALYRVREGGGWSEQDIARLHLLAGVLSSLVKRERMEAARRDSEDRFRRLAENANDALCEMDGEGSFLFISPNAQTLLGYAPTKVRDDDVFALIHPDDQRRVADQHALRQRTGQAQRNAYRVRHQDGGWRWIEAVAQEFRNASDEVRVALVLRDVTEAHAHREALEQQLEIQKRIADFSRQFLERAGAEHQNAIEQGLEAAARLAGADRAFLVASAARADQPALFFDWHDKDVPPRPSLEADEHESSRRYSSRLLHAGRLVHAPRIDDLPEDAPKDVFRAMGVKSFLLIPIHDGDRLLGVLGFHCLLREKSWQDQEIALLRLVAGLFTSLLRRFQAEDDLRESQARLVQAQKMEAVGTLAGGIAHDFNNQLAVMLGNARYVKRNLEEDGLREALGDVERAAEHCAQLTRSLLAFSRRTGLAPGPIDVADALGKVCELLAPLMPKSIEFSVEVNEDAGTVIADPTQFQQVLLNLAVNARDAMPDGGRLEISARTCEVDARGAERLGLRPGGFVELSVIDDGVGMDPETRSRIFEPFFTTKDPGRGTGLGLATAYGIVQDSEGAIDVESAPGEGTAFRVLLPRTDACVERERSGAAVSGARGTGTVLLAEDENGVRRYLARTLRNAGYEVVEAGDGVEALEKLAQVPGVDFLVADLEMPRMGGIELARELAGRDARVRVLLLSGHAPDPRSVGEPSLAEAAFLQKPFADEALLETLTQLRAA